MKRKIQRLFGEPDAKRTNANPIAYQRLLDAIVGIQRELFECGYWT